MKALSPGRPSSVRRGSSAGGSLLSDPGLGILSRGSIGGKGPASSSSSSTFSSSSSSLSSSSEDPLSLLYNMNDCYSKLKELVPSIPQNKKVSKMEILQHVIDYILDLQIALDTHPAAALVGSLHHPRAPGPGPSRSPLAALNTDITILSLQAAEFPSELMSNDSKALCG